MHKYLKNLNRSYNSKAKKLHMHSLNQVHKSKKRCQTVLKLKKKSTRTHCGKFDENLISKNFSITEDDETYVKYNHQNIPVVIYFQI